ncbi:MAG: hypothetical protein IJ601_13050 [Acidaminococcaceae bacterium]|nr:hypothetical protein [Acidaminococcaceae bacterium]
MKYSKVVPGIFIKRPNRFIAHIMINGNEEICHVKNTGRCKELLIPGCTVYCSVSDNPQRKTKFDLIAVEKNKEWPRFCHCRNRICSKQQCPPRAKGQK